MHSRRLHRAAVATGLLATLSLGPALAASGAEPTPDAVDYVTLLVGETENDRNFTWYSRNLGPETLVLAPSAQMDGTEFPDGARRIDQSAGGLAVNRPGWSYHHAEVEGLEPATEYTYQVGTEDGWSELHTFTTGSGGPLELVMVGDPQIGTTDLEAERLQWHDTLEQAWNTYPDAEMLLSAGDQVDRIFADDDEYSAFHEPEQLTRYPLAATLGNHDVAHFVSYGDHFNLPHGGGRGDFNYHYTNGETLFIHLNSNNLFHGSLVEYARQAMEQNPARWVVVTFHHSIYSVATHATDVDAEGLGIIEGRREALSRGMSELGVDLVISGHDHYYTRTPLMNHGVAVDGPDDDPTTGPDLLVPGDGDVLYVTANTSTGSKYYGRNDDLPEPAPWGEVENQENAANYSHLAIDECAITVTTHRAEQSADPVTGAVLPDNSLVDQVELSGDETGPAITAPDVEVTARDTFDPLAGVTTTDACDPGPLTPVVTGDVDADVPGTYVLTYEATDRSGNATTVDRTVAVVEAPEEPSEDPGETPSDGPGETPSDGPEDPGETPTDGPGETPTDGPGETPTDGPGETPTDGSGETPTDGTPGPTQAAGPGNDGGRDAGGSDGSGHGGGGGLADTGASVGGLVALAAGLTVAGGLLHLARRRHA